MKRPESAGTPAFVVRQGRQDFFFMTPPGSAALFRKRSAKGARRPFVRLAGVKTASGMTAQPRTHAPSLTFDSIRKRRPRRTTCFRTAPASGSSLPIRSAPPEHEARSSSPPSSPRKSALDGGGAFFSHRQRVKTSADAFASSPPSLRSPPAPCARPAGATRQTRPAGAGPQVRQARKRRTEAQSFALQQCRASFPADALPSGLSSPGRRAQR